jgi:hypothetical protein
MAINVFIPTRLSVNRYTTHYVIFRGVWEDIIKMDLRKLGCEDVSFNCVRIGSISGFFRK